MKTEIIYNNHETIIKQENNKVTLKNDYLKEIVKKIKHNEKMSK